MVCGGLRRRMSNVELGSKSGSKLFDFVHPRVDAATRGNIPHHARHVLAPLVSGIGSGRDKLAVRWQPSSPSAYIAHHVLHPAHIRHIPFPEILAAF